MPKQKISFVDYVQKMHNKPFSVPNLIRKITPYYKTVTFSGGKTFTLVNKDNGNAVRLTYLSNVYNDSFYITCNWSSKFGKTITFDFFVGSGKELLQKLLKHDLI